jgi:hypothetical protein
MFTKTVLKPKGKTRDTTPLAEHSIDGMKSQLMSALLGGLNLKLLWINK